MKYEKQGWVCKLTLDNGEIVWRRRGTNKRNTYEPNFYDRKVEGTYTDPIGHHSRCSNGWSKIVSSEWLPCTETIEVVE